MAGGTFTIQNKIRAGTYHRFTGEQTDRNLFATIGTAALPIELDWGENGQMITIEAGQDPIAARTLEKLGAHTSDILLVNECLKRAKTLLVYRINSDGGIKAELDMTPQPVITTAKYEGSLGNSIRVQLDDDPNNTGKYTVKTYLNAMLMDTQANIENAEDIKGNDWVTFTGIGAITAAAGGSLAGGKNGKANATTHNDFLKALESEDFNAFGLPYNDSVVAEMYATAVKHYANDIGKLVQCILPKYDGEPYEGITSVINGVEMPDGSIIDATNAVAWVVGASASAGAATSLTYTAYDGAIRPDNSLDDTDIKKAIVNGKMVFTAQRNEQGQPTAVVEQDINTLKVATKDLPVAWKKNRVARSMFYLVNSVSRTWNLFYIGKVDNNTAGQMLFKADLVNIMTNLVDQGAFTNFDAESDIEVARGESIDAVTVNLLVQPVDAMEKLYITIEVK